MKKQAFGILVIIGLAGCAASRPGDDRALLFHDGSPYAERSLDQAIASYRLGEYKQADSLITAALPGASAYRVMPEMLYLLGHSRLARGERGRAADCFSLLQSYYPHRWTLLPDHARLESVLAAARDTARAGGPGEAGPDESPAVAVTRTGAAGGAPHPDARVTNLFYETDIRQVLADISAQVGIPIVAGEGVSGLVTAEFDQLPLADCLDRLCLSLGLSHRWLDGYYLVGVADPSSPTSLPLFETVVLRPRHLLARDLMQMLPPYYQRYLRVPATGDNLLAASGPAEILAHLRSDLAAIDRPPRQVLIEAMVVEVDEDHARDWGIDWEILGDGSFRLAKLAPALLDSALIGEFFDSDITGLGDVTDIRAGLRMLEARGEARIRANPQVTTLDGKEARIRVGSEAYYSLLSGSVSYSYYTLQKIATGISLKITPHIGASAEIITDIAVEVSDVSAAGANDLPVTSVREVETCARVDNGASVLIGGLLSETERTNTNRIPILGSLPLLGGLFGHTSLESGQSEVFVLVTPHILIHAKELTSLLE
ncbi:MAG: hypothetical protein JW819_13370 [Candidatus Krumholzibacteriota bacterium]|nr:hypothetical protein [Candidatus Krumholzibacteriota bacterium]